MASRKKKKIAVIEDSIPSEPVYVSVDEKLNSDFYKNKLEYPSKNKVIQMVKDSAGTVTEHDLYKKFRNEYYTEEGRLQELFKQDAFAELRLLEKMEHYDPSKHPIAHCTGDPPNVLYKHPKAELLFSKALEMGRHSNGLHEVWIYMVEMAELLQ